MLRVGFWGPIRSWWLRLVDQTWNRVIGQSMSLGLWSGGFSWSQPVPFHVVCVVRSSDCEVVQGSSRWNQSLGEMIFHPFSANYAPSECCRMLIYFAIFSRKLTLAVRHQVKISTWVMANISWDGDCIIPQCMKHLGCGSQAFLSHRTSEDFVRLPKTNWWVWMSMIQ